MRETWDVKNITSRDLTGLPKPRRIPIPKVFLGRSAAGDGVAAAVSGMLFGLKFIAISSSLYKIDIIPKF